MPIASTGGGAAPKTDQCMVARVLTGSGPAGELRFSDSFIIGRTRECGLQIREASVSRAHVEIAFDGWGWRLKDLGSGNGTFVNGQRVDELDLPEGALVELGKDGPRISLVVERIALPQDLCDAEPVTMRVDLSPRPAPPAPEPRKELASETQIMQRYFTKSDSGDAGEQTMLFRRAFERAHRKKSRKYQYVLAFALVLLVAAGSVILLQRHKLEKLRTTAENIFYLMKSIQIQIGRLEEVALLNANPAQLAELQAKRDRVKGMEQEYDNFMKELDLYAKVSPEDRVIMRVARAFGECEVNIPRGFFDEVKKYIVLWKSSDRLQNALNRAQQKGYTQLIGRTLRENNLPPQFFFLALQESNFDERAVGPATRYGNAKGMWQFIAATARDYGLRIGPLYDQPVYDPQDDRFDSAKSTVAATKYIKELNTTQAQASGLLVMASYNWGEGNVIKIIDQMPPNPRQRNFWRLLSMKDIPRETYDYVFSIFSAAVICEDPKLFGFGGSCPAFDGPNPPGRQTAAGSSL